MLSLVLGIIGLCYCLDRGRTYRVINNNFISEECIWKAEEIDCVFYSRNTNMYKKIKEKYEIEDENMDYLLGIISMEEEYKPVIISFSSHECLVSEVYYDEDLKNFMYYEDEAINSKYKMNVLKNKFSLYINDESNIERNSSILEYLNKQNLDKITFIKSKEEYKEPTDIVVNTETEETLYDRYEDEFSVDVLSTVYNRKKKQIEIVVRNNNEFDIDKVCFNIGIIGKTGYQFVNEWKYEDVLPYEGDYVVSFYSGGIQAKGEDTVIIDGIDDEEIVDIMTCVSNYEHDSNIYNNFAKTIFFNMVNKANEIYFKQVSEQ